MSTLSTQYVETGDYKGPKEKYWSWSINQETGYPNGVVIEWENNKEYCKVCHNSSNAEGRGEVFLPLWLWKKIRKKLSQEEIRDWENYD